MGTIGAMFIRLRDTPKKWRKKKMGRVVKTISLDQMTAAMADNIPNFSSWVRTQLLIEHIAQGGQTLHVVEQNLRGFMIKVPTKELDGFGRRIMENIKLDKCNPYHKDGLCLTCWPPENSPEGHIAKMIEERMEGSE